MTQVPVPALQQQAQREQPATVAVASWPWTFRVLFDFFAFAFWAYVLLKLFVFDVDIYVLRTYLPELLWLLDYRFFIFLGVIATMLALLGTKVFLAWAAYILFFPFIILFWKLPSFIFRSGGWILTLAVAEFVLSFFRSFRYHVIATALFLAALVVAVTSYDPPLLYFGAVILSTLLLVIYGRAVHRVFRPMNLFELHRKVFSKLRPIAETTAKLDDGLKGLPVERMNPAQMQKWTGALQTSLVFNRVTLLYARKLRLYQSSPVGYISGIITTFALLLVTAITFAAINYALYKADPKQFITTSEPSGFVFLYYSFKNLFSSSINEIVPSGGFSYALSVAENLSAFFLVTILVALLLQVRAERYSSELNEAIAAVEAEGLAMERFIRSEYKIETVDDALDLLERTKKTTTDVMLKFLLYLTSGLK